MDARLLVRLTNTASRRSRHAASDPDAATLATNAAFAVADVPGLDGMSR